MLKKTASIVTYQSCIGKLGKCLDSLKKLNLIEIIVVDNSVDSTYFRQLRRLINESYSSMPIKLIDLPKNIGFGRAHNHGVANLSMESDVHFFVNPDISIVYADLEFVEKFFLEGGYLIAPKVLYPNGRLQYNNTNSVDIKYLLSRRFSFVKDNRRRLLSDTLEKNFIDHSIKYVSGCFMCVHREKFLEIGGFDDKFFMYFEDFDLSRRISEISDKAIIVTSKVTVIHDWARESKENLRLKFYLVRSLIKFWFI